MEGPKKPTLKLKLSRNPSISSSGPASASQNETTSFFGQAVTTPDAMSPSSTFPGSSSAIPSSAGPSAGLSAIMPPPAFPPTPTEGGKRKITLKMTKSQPSTPITENPPNRTPLPSRTPLPAKPPPAEPAVAPLTTTKAGRTLKPSARKRAQNEETDEEEDMNPPPSKKSKVTVKVKTGGEDRRNSMNIRKILFKDKLTTHSDARQPGSGFDSEMEDAETDPITEEEIVLRMLDGPECDYINECLNSKKFPSGGMEFKLKWVEERRAAVTVQTQLFAAVLVDLPTITESTKTWDKKLVVKSADICQMLLVFKRITREEEARTAELPKVIFDGYRWPHGLTPPMHDVVHRRFRKRLHKSDILNKEQEVDRLLKADKDAISTRYEYIGDRRDTLQADTPNAEMIDADGEEDAEGEIEEIYEANVNGVENGFEAADLEAELQRELEAGMEDEFSMDTPAQADATPAAPPETPAPGLENVDAQGDDDLFGDVESAEDYDDDDDEESDEDLDPAEKQRREGIRSVRDEVRDIERQIKGVETKMAEQQNMLLKKRLQDRIKALNNDKRLKLASIGELPPEDDEEED